MLNGQFGKTFTKHFEKFSIQLIIYTMIQIQRHGIKM